MRLSYLKNEKSNTGKIAFLSPDGREAAWFL